METVYQFSTEQVLKHFKTSAAGLKDNDVLLLQSEFGENTLTETKHKSKWLILLAQFADVMIFILIIAASLGIVIWTDQRITLNQLYPKLNFRIWMIWFRQ